MAFLFNPAGCFYIYWLGWNRGQDDFDTRIRFIIVDQAQSSLSSQLIDVLSDSEAIRPEVATMVKAERVFAQRQVPAILIIPASFMLDEVHFTPQVVELRQQPNNMDALVVEQAVAIQITYLSSTVDIANASVAEAEMISPFDSDRDRAAYFAKALTMAQDLYDNSPERLNVMLGVTTDSINYDPGVNSSAGQLITWVFIPLIGLSAIFAYERINGTLRRLLISPTEKATYLLGTIFAYVLTAMVQMLLLIGFAVLVLRVNWGRSPGAMALILFASALAAGALGTALGAFVKTASQANGLSVMIGMLMALFGGCWYPRELFPESMRKIVRILPTTWAMEGILNIIVRGEGLLAVLPTAGVLLGFAVVFFTLGVWCFKFE